jgi:hypothetical protein
MVFEEVELPHEDAPLHDDLLAIKNVPPALVPDANGCYCFSPDDDRFAYAHAFFHAHEELVAVNARLADLGLPAVGGITLTLSKGPTGFPANGDTPAFGLESRIAFSSPVVDTSLLLHEVAHAIHDAVKPYDRAETFTPFNIVELNANVVAMLILRSTAYCELNLLDGAFDMLRDLHFPDRVVTLADTSRGWIAAPKLSAAYPAFVKMLSEQLPSIVSDGDNDPYANSALVAGPVLSTAQRFGYDDMLRVWLKSISEVPHTASLSRFVPVLVANSGALGTEAQQSLRDGLQRRGVLP